MQGIYLAFQGCEKNILKTLLSGIDFSDYQFEVGHFEARKEFFLHPDWEYLEQQRLITSEDAKKRFLENEDDYEHIENLALYVRNKSIRKKHIQTFKDLVDGHYDLALKIVDHNSIQVYSTHDEVLNKILKNAYRFDRPIVSLKPFEHVDLNTQVSL
ncbi:MAG TPA: DUF2691 family protein [Acholeplasmataceae bacterium]|jgi:hypothetical protein|nr:DUF2691 family protein [Acholeplasmataceae bacterium]